jgi:hypothetical protein
VASGAHLTVDPPVEEFVWEGGRVILPFEVAVGAAASIGSTVRCALGGAEQLDDARGKRPFKERVVVMLSEARPSLTTACAVLRESAASGAAPA